MRNIFPLQTFLQEKSQVQPLFGFRKKHDAMAY
jgi:hypothetical protein